MDMLILIYILKQKKEPHPQPWEIKIKRIWALGVPQGQEWIELVSGALGFLCAGVGAGLY